MRAIAYERARKRLPRTIGARALFVISGQLVSTSGQPIVGAQVFLLDWPTWALIASTTSDAGGSFTFNPPHNGQYRVSHFLAGAPNQFGLSDILVPS